jgi:hypothetical protein
MSIIPIFIHSHSSSRPRPTPKCPHCSHELKGWSEPDSESCNGLFILLTLFLFVQFCFFLKGFMDAGIFEKCEPMYSKRYHYVVPLYPLMCHGTLWLAKDVGDKEADRATD